MLPSSLDPGVIGRCADCSETCDVTVEFNDADDMMCLGGGGGGGEVGSAPDTINGFFVNGVLMLSICRSLLRSSVGNRRIDPMGPSPKRTGTDAPSPLFAPSPAGLPSPDLTQGDEVEDDCSTATGDGDADESISVGGGAPVGETSPSVVNGVFSLHATSSRSSPSMIGVVSTLRFPLGVGIVCTDSTLLVCVEASSSSSVNTLGLGEGDDCVPVLSVCNNPGVPLPSFEEVETCEGGPLFFFFFFSFLCFLSGLSGLSSSGIGTATELNRFLLLYFGEDWLPVGDADGVVSSNGCALSFVSSTGGCWSWKLLTCFTPGRIGRFDSKGKVEPDPIVPSNDVATSTEMAGVRGVSGAFPRWESRSSRGGGAPLSPSVLCGLLTREMATGRGGTGGLLPSRADPEESTEDSCVSCLVKTGASSVPGECDVVWA